MPFPGAEPALCNDDGCEVAVDGLIHRDFGARSKHADRVRDAEGSIRIASRQDHLHAPICMHVNAHTKTLLREVGYAVGHVRPVCL